MRRKKELTNLKYNIHIREKEKGLQLIVSYKKSNGKWAQRTKQPFASKQEAKAYAWDLIKEIEEEERFNLSPEKITFKELADDVVELLFDKRERGTIASYRTAIRAVPSLHDKYVRDITQLDVQRAIDKIKNKKENTYKSYTLILHAIFNKAIKPFRLISENPVQDIEYRKEKGKKKVSALTDEEVSFLYDYFDSPIDKMVVTIGTTCGLRCSELLGLTWEDVDLEHGVIDINKQWKKGKGTNKCSFGALKSVNSERVIPLPQDTIEAFDEYRQIVNPDFKDRVIPYPGAWTLDRKFRKFSKLIGKRITTHKLRHTYATNLIRGGMNFKSAAKLLGHSVQETMRTYSHVTEDMDNESAILVRQIFNNGTNASFRKTNDSKAKENLSKRSSRNTTP